MKFLGILLASFALICSPLVAQEPLRVGGAEVIESTDDLQAALFQVVGQPLTQSEVDLLLKHETEILKWANENSEQWLSADDAENPLKAIRNFPIWKKIDITSSEFVAVVSKIMFHNESSQKAINLKNLNIEKAQMESFLESPELPAEAKPEVEAMIAYVTGMIDIVENVLPKNVPVFMKNKRELESFVSGMQAIGEGL